MLLSCIDSYALSNFWEDITFDSFVFRSVCWHMYIQCCMCSTKYRFFCIMHLYSTSLIRSRLDITFSIFSGLADFCCLCYCSVLVADCKLLQSPLLPNSLHLTRYRVEWVLEAQMRGLIWYPGICRDPRRPATTFTSFNPSPSASSHWLELLLLPSFPFLSFLPYTFHQIHPAAFQMFSLQSNHLIQSWCLCDRFIVSVSFLRHYR